VLVIVLPMVAAFVFAYWWFVSYDMFVIRPIWWFQTQACRSRRVYEWNWKMREQIAQRTWMELQNAHKPTTL